MRARPASDKPNQIAPENCFLIKNPPSTVCDPEDGQSTSIPPTPPPVTSGESSLPFPRCCFFCGPSKLNRKCTYAPELCGAIRPPNGICVYEWTRTITWGTQLESFADGTLNETYGFSDVTRGNTTCYDFLGEPLDEGAASGAGEDTSFYGGAGPILFTRTTYPDGASGQVPVVGVARDDDWGVTQLYFWLDEEPVALSGLQTGLYDAWTCTETPNGTPGAGCDAFSGFSGTLDVSGLAAGPHRLVIAAVNGRGEPIPTYYEQEFTVGVDPCAGDTFGPSVQLSNLVDGQIVADPATVTVSASDPAGVSAVDLYVDGAYRQVDTVAPWSFTAPLGPGEHRLRAKAYDACGNHRFSPEVLIEVASGGTVTRRHAALADTWSNQDHPATAFGDRSILRMRTSAGGHGRHTYLKFHVDDCPGGASTARLWFRTQDRELLGDLGVYRLLDTSWSEGTLTWLNAPLAYDAVMIIPGPFGAESWQGVDVTSLVTGNGVWSLGLATSSNAGQQDLLSRESLAVLEPAPYLELSCRAP
ncbi:MAG: Ig-like domain-containing protein [Acidobacteriota bacterium]